MLIVEVGNRGAYNIFLCMFLNIFKFLREKQKINGKHLNIIIGEELNTRKSNPMHPHFLAAKMINGRTTVDKTIPSVYHVTRRRDFTIVLQFGKNLPQGSFYKVFDSNAT